MTSFTTKDQRQHILAGGQLDGIDIVRILHDPMVGECAEFDLVGGWLLTLPITTITYSK